MRSINKDHKQLSADSVKIATSSWMPLRDLRFAQKAALATHMNANASRTVQWLYYLNSFQERNAATCKTWPFSIDIGAMHAAGAGQEVRSIGVNSAFPAYIMAGCVHMQVARLRSETCCRFLRTANVSFPPSASMLMDGGVLNSKMDRHHTDQHHHAAISVLWACKPFHMPWVT